MRLAKSGVNAKIYLIFIVMARLTLTLAGLLPERGLLFVSNQTYSCACIFLLYVLLLV